MSTPADRNDAGGANLAVLSNAVELSTQIILKSAGNDTANTVNGASITDAYVADAVAARLQAKLAPYVGGV